MTDTSQYTPPEVWVWEKGSYLVTRISSLVMMVSGKSHNGLSLGIGSTVVTSRPAPAILPARIAAIRASSSINAPRLRGIHDFSDVGKWCASLWSMVRKFLGRPMTEADREATGKALPFLPEK